MIPHTTIPEICDAPSRMTGHRRLVSANILNEAGRWHQRFCRGTSTAHMVHDEWGNRRATGAEMRNGVFIVRTFNTRGYTVNLCN